MNVFTRIGSRAFQAGLYVGMTILHFREPKVIEGENSILKISNILKENSLSKPLFVTDESIFKLGLANPMLEQFTKDGILYATYHGVNANPTVIQVEAGLKTYIENKCDCIVAVGGGSALDCAKAIGARVVYPNRTVNSMRGQLKIHRNLPTLIAVPTTAGTGSETTVAAVIVDSEKGDKYAINTPRLIPQYAVLDPTLLIGLPKGVTSTTGMDALTHAVEAFIGHANTKRTKRNAIEAVQLTFNNLEKSVNDPKNITYRNKMQIAAYKAGVAFTNAYVGNVHSLAHALGGKYNVAHGYANALLLPIVLRKYGKSIYKKCGALVDALGNKELTNNAAKTQWFINEIDKMNERMGIVNTLKETIKIEDLDALVNHAYKESIPLYPTPKLLTKKQLKECYLELIK